MRARHWTRTSKVGGCCYSYNFEQVAAAAPLVAELLAAAPGLKVLVTSREPLHLASVSVVPPASVCVADDAAALFVERARAVRPDFALTDENAPAVAEICARLDGLPLAIELAAARIRVLPPTALLARLERAAAAADRRRARPAGAPADAARHDRLELRPARRAEQRCFRRLAVFAGGFTLEAAEAVLGRILTVIGSLVDRSLIRRSAERYEMLATIREYAAEKLAEQPDADAVHERHAAFFESLTDRAFADRYRDQAAMADLLAARPRRPA